MEKYRFDMLDGLRASEEKADEESLEELLFDIHDELAEAVKAAKGYIRKPILVNRLHLACELADTQFTCETLMDALGYNQPERDAIRKEVASGNEQAGYYDKNCDMYSLFCKHSSGVVIWQGTFGTENEAVAKMKQLVEDDRKHERKGRDYYIGASYHCKKLYDSECGF